MKQKIWKNHSQNTSPPKSTSDIISLLLKNRHLESSLDIHNFLNPTLDIIKFNIGDIDDVIKRLSIAVQKKEKIVVYGDYDADGVTATAIMWETLYALGANVTPYIPHREKEGYGLSTIGIDHLFEKEQVQLIITVDQGISGKRQIDYAHSKNIEVIVTDHHSKPALLPTNCLIVHDSNVCGAAVSWKVATQLLRYYREKFPDSIASSAKLEQITKINPITNLPQKSMELLELVAIGTICDLIPLVGESRSLVKFGLEALKSTTRPGILALLSLANLKPSDIQAYHVGFVIGPRINATGRLEHAIDSLRLLCTNNQTKANELAQKLNTINTDRIDITFQMINAAQFQANQQQNKKLLIIGDPTWNPGVIGLVASRMVEEFYKPTIAWGSSPDHPEQIKASARSIKSVNIINTISQFHTHLTSHGGHPMAAGLSLNAASLANFTKEIQQYADTNITDELLIPTLDIDCQLPLPLITQELYYEIQNLKPFGMGAQEPIFQTPQMNVLECSTLGAENKHLKLKISSETNQIFEAIAFNFGTLSSQIRPNNPISLAYNIDINEWNNKKKLQLKVRDIKL
ncbi:MAG: single-stranded-DNA-specific exonuclease RecJ [bacterium]|nr:single-stranded-DNA-specific exonuclease RecJ [bacterium]